MKIKLFLFTVCMLFCQILVSQTIRYVSTEGTNTAPTTAISWEKASNDLQAVIDVSSKNDKIFVAKGTYKSNRPAYNLTIISENNRDNAFVLKEGIKIYGGFSGTETGDESTRTNILTTNKTILSGDFNDNDDVTGSGSTLAISNNAENAHHIIICANNITSATVIDGFIISGGYANGSSTFDGSNFITVNTKLIDKSSGGGIYIESSSPTITNIIFTENSAFEAGGMVNSSSSSPIIDNVTFSNNLAFSNGGGMYNHTSAPVVSNLLFSNNLAITNGGGMYNDNSSLTIVNSIFSKNSAKDGGGVYNANSTPIITNSTFSKNAGNGGGVYNNNSSPTITNSIFWENIKEGSVNIDGADIENNSSSPNVSYSLTQIYGANGVANNKVGTDDSNNPKFVDIANDNFNLLINSPAIDAGNNEAINVITDALGNPRKDGIVDMGAFEFVKPKIRYISTTGVNANPELALSWEAASNDLQAVINASKNGDKIFVAKGIYKPIRRSDDLTIIDENNLINSFVLKEGVKIYGGFSGTEMGDETTRTNIRTINKTTLSGDFNGDDIVTGSGSTLSIDNNNENALHVVIGIENITNATVFDGFTVSGGKGRGISFVLVNGTVVGTYTAGGMVNIGASPIINNVTFFANESVYGGGMYNRFSSPVITNVFFSNNIGTAGGGGVYIESSFTEDKISEFSLITITNTTFSGNFGLTGGGISSGSSDLNINNATFYDNSAEFGGGAYYERVPLDRNLPKPKVNITNSIFWKNNIKGDSDIRGADIIIGSSSSSFRSIITVSYCLTQANSAYGSRTGFVNNQNPKFVDAVNENFRLLPGSPAINAGDNSKIEDVLLDANNNPRRYNNTVIDMGAYEYQSEFNEWLGNSTNWENAINWSKNIKPNNTSEVFVGNDKVNYPVIPSTLNLDIKSINLEDNASLTLNTGATLKIAEVRLGEITYNMTPEDIKQWYLISSPLVEDFTPSVMATSDLVDKSSTNTNIALATYTNIPDADGAWIFYQDTNTQVQDFEIGKGYYTNFDTGSISGFPFKGVHAPIPSSIGITVSNFGNANENSWNLVGNPYLTNLDISQFLNDNKDVLTTLHQAVYVWETNEEGSGFFEPLIKGQLNVGQAFFVSAKNPNGDKIIFSDEARVANDSSRKSSQPSITLFANELPTTIQFLDGASNGFDAGLDIGLFTGRITTDFGIHTQLVDNSQDERFMLQSVPISTIETIVIPIGITAEAGKKINFSIIKQNVSDDIIIHLEDKLTNTLTELSTDNYEVTVNNNIDGVGRFYLQVSGNILSTIDDVDLENISIFKTNRNTLKVNGIKNANASLKVFNILGKQVFVKQLNAFSNQEVVLPNLNEGVYIVQLKTANNSLNKKIVLE